MALINVVYPVTGSLGSYQNIFPSQKRLDFKLTRIDEDIEVISSGTGGLIRIVSVNNMTGISVGDYVTFGSDAYPPQSARVTNVINSSVIEVDLFFTSSNANNGFINYKKDWFLELRFVQKESVSNDQNAINILGFTTKVNSSLDGSVVSNLSLPYVFLNPDFSTSASFNNGLFKEFKIQYRESWQDNRSRNWISPSPDVPIMLVHATRDLKPLSFNDDGVLKKFVRGYPLLGTFIYSDINDGAGGNNIILRRKSYAINKTLIDDVVILNQANFNGVYVFSIDTNDLDTNAVFIKLEYDFVASIEQYDPLQYDPADYS